MGFFGGLGAAMKQGGSNIKKNMGSQGGGGGWGRKGGGEPGQGGKAGAIGAIGEASKRSKVGLGLQAGGEKLSSLGGSLGTVSDAPETPSPMKRRPSLNAGFDMSFGKKKKQSLMEE